MCIQTNLFRYEEVARKLVLVETDVEKAEERAELAEGGEFLQPPFPGPVRAGAVFAGRVGHLQE